MPLHLAFGQGAHAVDEVVPLRDGDAELLLHRLGIEASVVRHLDRPAAAVQGNGQGVVADHAHGGRRGGGGQGAVAGGGQQQIAVDLVVALERSALPGSCQRPELAATLQDTGRFQLVAGNLSEIAVELQHFTRLHGVVALGNYRQRCLGVRTVEHLLFGE
ncbi:hypothetical protein D9M69_487380 [compost metagenome]